MSNRSKASFYMIVSSALAVVSGLAFFNNATAVWRWWSAFNQANGDATQIPAKSPGLIPWLDWTAVDYSCVTTFIPFIGFLMIALGTAKIAFGKRVNATTFPFFRAYDQMNISLGLIGTLWGIIIIGYFDMETVTMGHLIMCLHTALFSTLMAVVWVFIVDHAMLRPLVRGLVENEDDDGSDEDAIEVIDRLRGSAAGLVAVWDGNRESLHRLNEGIASAGGGIEAFGNAGRAAGEALKSELGAAVRAFVGSLDSAGQALEARQTRMEEAFKVYHAKLDAGMAQMAGNVESIAGIVSGLQDAQRGLAAAAEKLMADNAALAEGIVAERKASNELRGRVSELGAESEARRKQLEEAIARMGSEADAFNKRLERLRDEMEGVSKEKARIDGERVAALKEAEQSLVRASKAEKLLEKVKSAFGG